jgi:hypothetical protein
LNQEENEEFDLLVWNHPPYASSGFEQSVPLHCQRLEAIVHNVAALYEAV